MKRYYIIRDYTTKQYLGNSSGFITWVLDFREAERFYATAREHIKFSEYEKEELEHITFEIIELFTLED